MTRLSTAKQRVLDAIRGYIVTHGIPPTVREIGAITGLSSPSTVHKHLCDLAALGSVEWQPGAKCRTIQLCENPLPRCADGDPGANELTELRALVANLRAALCDIEAVEGKSYTGRIANRALAAAAGYRWDGKVTDRGAEPNAR